MFCQFCENDLPRIPVGMIGFWCVNNTQNTCVANHIFMFVPIGTSRNARRFQKVFADAAVAFAYEN